MMKKTLLATLAVSALPALAHAEAEIYGSLRVGIDSIKSSATGFQSVTGVDDFYSRIGFRGTEDLGNGLKAVWQVESGVPMDGVTTGGSGSGTIANRPTYLGLAGSFGKLTMGYVGDVLDETEVTDTFYGAKRSNKVFPLYEGTDLFGTYGDGFNKNSVRYDSPNINGASATVIYGAGEAANHVGDNQGVRLAYSNAASGLFGAYAYMGVNKQAGDKNGQTHRVEFGYNANNLFVAGTYQWLKVYGNATSLGVANSSAELKNQSWAFSVAYALGPFKPKFLYSKRNNPVVDGAEKDWGAKQWVLGVDYSLSKATLLETGYAQVTNNAGAQAALKQSDRKSSVVYLMMKHNF